MTRHIVLTTGLTVLVDDDMYDLLAQWKWHNFNGYAGRLVGPRNNRKLIRMHRFIVDAPDGYEVDHIDRNKLNNQRHNLRICTRAENMRNRKSPGGASRYKGVSWSSRERRWRAVVRVNRKSIHLGLFQDEISAARAYDAAARFHFGAFALCNFAEEDRHTTR